MRPGHRGIWQEPLRTGKYAINPRVYAAEIVPTFILTLNWAEATSEAHDLDAHLSSIVGKSREGFVFQIDLQVQIHVPDTAAPKVISMVGTMRNLVNEVLQSRGRQPLPQHAAGARGGALHRDPPGGAERGVRGDHRLPRPVPGRDARASTSRTSCSPTSWSRVLTEREIANQEKATFEEQQRAETSRIEMEKAKGTANMQSQLASAQVGVQIKTNEAQAREAEARGEAAYVKLTGEAEAARTQAIGLAEAKATEALGLARATGFEAQKAALGGPATALVAVANAVADGHVTVVPEVLVTGGGGSIDGLAATLIRSLRNGGDVTPNGNGRGTPASTSEPELVFVAEVSDSDESASPAAALALARLDADFAAHGAAEDNACHRRGPWPDDHRKAVIAEPRRELCGIAIELDDADLDGSRRMGHQRGTRMWRVTTPLDEERKRRIVGRIVDPSHPPLQPTTVRCGSRTDLHPEVKPRGYVVDRGRADRPTERVDEPASSTRPVVRTHSRMHTRRRPPPPARDRRRQPERSDWPFPSSDVDPLRSKPSHTARRAPGCPRDQTRRSVRDRVRASRCLDPRPQHRRCSAVTRAASVRSSTCPSRRAGRRGWP